MNDSPKRSFWSDYFRSLKPLEVEEPIDVWVHRPLAYILAKALLPTPVSPNLVTFGSILLGAFAGYSFVVSYPWHLQIGAGALFLSAVFDCADGQLARLRGTSSRFGRMLDGVADLVVIAAAVLGASWHLLQRYGESPISVAMVLGAIAATAVTGSFGTSLYDHYKNLFLRLTTPSYREGEDYATALARYRERPADEFGPLARLAWPPYLFYVKSQEQVVRGFDPYTTVTFSSLPPYDEARAAIYRRHAGPCMAHWRRWFGVGSLVFGFSVAAAVDLFEVFLIGRLVCLNALFYGYLKRAQREASQRAFEEMGVQVASDGVSV